MLTKTLLALVPLFVAAARAQGPTGFDPARVEQDFKDDWCRAQLNACPEICEDFAKENTCDAKQLTFSCVCSNDEEPKVSEYMSTLPYFICQETFKQCITNNPDDADGQEVCKENQKKCGSKNVTESGGSDSTTSLSPTGTLTTETGSPSPTGQEGSEGGEEEPTETPNAGLPVQMAQDYSLGILAAVFFGVFGFFL